MQAANFAKTASIKLRSMQSVTLLILPVLCNDLPGYAAAQNSCLEPLQDYTKKIRRLEK